MALQRSGALDQPISLARRLFAAGMTLPQAHAAITALAAVGWAVGPVAKTVDLGAIARDLATMNVLLRRRRTNTDSAADIAARRARHGLSQRDYADLLGIDLRTLQNWEQGRNRPDPAAVTLMRVFDRSPDAVEEALSEPLDA